MSIELEVQSRSSLYHEFDSGVRLWKSHLKPSQMARYETVNRHEPVEETWFEHIIRENATDESIFLDLGAAVGYYGILSRRLNSQMHVYSFEPLEEHRDFLRANLELNGVGSRDFHILNLAVSGKVGSAELVPKDYGSHLAAEDSGVLRMLKHGVHRLTQRSSKSDRTNSALVSTTTLDAFQVTIGKTIDLTKVDVQGTETQVLRGAHRCLKRRLVRNWIIGTHSSDLHVQCLGQLQKHGYHIQFESDTVEGQPDGLIVASSDPGCFSSTTGQ